MTLHVKHYTAMLLNNRNKGSHEVNKQFIKHFLIVQHKSSNQKVGPVAFVPVTTPVQYHFLKNYSFYLLTFFQSVCPEVFHAECLSQTGFLKDQSSVSAQTVQLLSRVRTKEKMFCIIRKKTQNKNNPQKQSTVNLSSLIL